MIRDMIISSKKDKMILKCVQKKFGITYEGMVVYKGTIFRQFLVTKRSQLYIGCTLEVESFLKMYFNVHHKVSFNVDFRSER